jgi:hypothetical protein
MKNLIGQLLLLDVAPEPVNSLPWAALMILFAIVLLLSVSFVVGLVFLLIWFKRRKLRSS